MDQDEFDHKKGYEELRDAIYEHLDSFCKDGEESEHYLLIEALKRAGKSFYRLHCSGCGRFIPRKNIHSISDPEAPSWAAVWDCDHCGTHDGNY